METIAPQTTGERPRLKYFDTFSGIGGFALPLLELGHECIGFSEIDRYAMSIYLHHFPDHRPYGDITRLEPAALPDFDLLVGGFPCQAFSVAGKRRGFLDTRGTLFFDVCRIAKEKRPRLLLLENVKGLLSHAGGDTFRTILSSLDELGYDAQWQVCNSRHFGVPQNRERVYLVGHLRGQPGPEVFPLSDGPESNQQENVGWAEDCVTGTISTKNQGPQCQFDSGTTLIGRWQNSRTGMVLDDVAPTLRASGGTDIRKRAVVLQRPRGKNLGGIRDDGLAPTLQKGFGDGNLAIMETLYTLGPERPDGRYRPRERIMDVCGVARAVTTFENQMPYYAASGTVRRLTPIECERLQGFPDNWTQWGLGELKEFNGIGGTPYRGLRLISDTQRYKTLGNAVTVNVVREIVTKLTHAQAA